MLTCATEDLSPSTRALGARDPGRMRGSALSAAGLKACRSVLGSRR